MSSNFRLPKVRWVKDCIVLLSRVCNFWSFYPSKLIYFAFFTVRHPVASLEKWYTLGVYFSSIAQVLSLLKSATRVMSLLATNPFAQWGKKKIPLNLTNLGIVMNTIFCLVKNIQWTCWAHGVKGLVRGDSYILLFKNILLQYFTT